MYDLIIIGGGPAGLTSAAYALRTRLNFLLIGEDLGGYVNSGFSLRGVPGPEFLSGREIVDNLKAQIEYIDFTRRLDRAERVEPIAGGFEVHTLDDRHFQGRTLIIATGASPQPLNVPGEHRLRGRGLSYSTVSHAPFLWNRPAALVGHSERVVRAAAELAHYAHTVYLILTAPTPLDSPLGRNLLAADHVHLLEGYRVREIAGHDFVEGLLVRSPAGMDYELAVDGVFIEEGLTPRSELVAGLVERDTQGAIIVNSSCATSTPGIFAAGDVTNVFGEQVLIAIGEGAKAGLAAREYLLEQEWPTRHQ